MSERCNCIKGVFDFDLLETKCSDIRYIDRSTWMTGADYSPTPNYILTIKHPSGSSSTHNIIVGSTNILDLGSCVESAIYNFSVETCGEPFSKDFPILCRLECGWLRAVAKLGKGVEIETIRSIRERIEFIKLAVSYGDIQTAQETLRTVELSLSRINCSCEC